MDSRSSNTRFFSLATRSTVLYSVLVAAAVLFAGWLIGEGNRDESLANRERDLEHRARTIRVRIETEIHAVASDAVFLARSPFLQQIADAGAPETVPTDLFAHAGQTFKALLESTPSYAQCRLLHLAEPGNELVRIDRRDGSVVAVSSDELQPKARRDYFKQSRQLLAGEVYLSPVNLNREFGEISTPQTPTLRAAAKLFDGTGEPYGLVVINVDLRTLFSELVATAGEDASLYIANAQGAYLVHPDPSKTFGFEFSTPHRLSDTFGSDPVTSPQSDDEVVRFVRFQLPHVPARELFIGVGTPRAKVLAELTRIRNRSLATALAAALLAAALVWILASKVEAQVEALDRAREAAEENKRAKEEFLATLSHEIRTPMNSVTGLVHALSTDSPADHQTAALNSLQFASRKLIGVVNDVLDFTKIEAGKLSFHRRPFDLHELLENIRSGNLPQARQGDVDLAIERAESVPRMVVGDSLRLYQALNNLVQNGLKFTKPGGQVTVTASVLEPSPAADTTVAFEVEDNGIGMTPEDLENALARFGQARREPSFGSTGLGLPIAKMLIELQGGRFEAHSSPGSGSRFRFELSFATPPEDPETEANDLGRTRDLRGARILCVEDVASNRLVVSALLDPTGAELTFAEDAASALSQLHGSPPPDLVLLDLQLPDRDGASLAADLREGWPDTPVVGLTAQTAGDLLERCKRAGVTTFIWKPVDPDRFFTVIAQKIDAASPPAPATTPVNTSPVLALFDGDETKAGRFISTLAAELEEAAGSLPSLAAAGDTGAIHRLRHRLQNGLHMIGASPLLEELSALAGATGDAARIKGCQRSLTATAASLRRAGR